MQIFQSLNVHFKDQFEMLKSFIKGNCFNRFGASQENGYPVYHVIFLLYTINLLLKQTLLSEKYSVKLFCIHA